MKDYNRTYFNNLFLREKDNSQRNRLRYKELLRHEQSGNLLEIGCGLGGFVRLAREQFNVECLEISDYAIKSLQNIKGVKLTQGDIETAILPENSYHVVAAFNVLEHLKSPEKAIYKIKRSLDAGGIFFGSVPNNHGLIGKTITRITDFVDKTHCSSYPLLRWKSILGAHFGSTEFFGEIQFGKNNALYTRMKGWQLISPNAVFICRK